MTELIGIAPMRIELLESYSKCLDIVCREKQWLCFSHAPNIELSRQYVEGLLKNRNPFLVAFTVPMKVVGWCDIGTGISQATSHCGTLGIGLLPEYRDQGIGRLLIQQCLRQCRTRRLERVQLDVLASNERARALYRDLGFEDEGLKKKAWKMDGRYEDMVLMAKHLP